MANARPNKPNRPTAAKTPTQPGRGGRKVSKTNDPRCTLAASRWQKAIKAGQPVPPDVKRELVRCQNLNRRKRFAEQRSARASHLMHLRKTGQRSEALQLIRQDRANRNARTTAAQLLRGLRSSSAAHTAAAARTVRQNLSGNETTRGAEIIQAIRNTVPRSSIRRAERRVGLAPAYVRPSRRRNQAETAPESTETTATSNPSRRRRRSSATQTETPQPTPVVRQPITRTFLQDMQHRRRTGNTASRSSVAAALRNMRSIGPVGREMARSASRFLHDPRGADVGTRMQPAEPARAMRSYLHEESTRIRNDLAIHVGEKNQNIRDRIRQNRFATQTEIAMRRENVLPTAQRLRIANAAYRGMGVTRTDTERSSNEHAARTQLGYIRAASTAATGNRPRGSSVSRTVYDMTRTQARQEIDRERQAASPPAAASSTRRRSSSTSGSGTRRRSTSTASTPAAPATPRPAPISRHWTPERLQAARTQAGPVGDYSASHANHPAATRTRAVNLAENTIGLQLMGSTTDEKFAHLIAVSGIPAALAKYARVEVGQYEIRLKLGGLPNDPTDPDRFALTLAGGFSRTLTRENGDRINLHNDYFVPPKSVREAGMATDFYARSITAARAAGVDTIDVIGGGGPGSYDFSGPEPVWNGRSMTGYHTWPEYGFNSRLNSQHQSGFARAHPQLTNVSTLNDALFHSDPDAAAAARRYWMQYGNGANFTLNLRDDNDSSWKAWNQFYKRRRRSEYSTNSLQTNNSRNGNYSIYGV